MKKKEVRRKIVEAPLSKRVFAYVVDWYLGWVFTALPVAYMWTVISQKAEMNMDITLFESPYGYIAGILGILFGIIYYFVFPLISDGQTLGKKFLSIKIVGENNEKLSAKNLAIRQILGVMIAESSFILAGNYLAQMIGMITFKEVGTIITYVMLAGFIISCIMVLRKQRAIHDILAHSKVIEKNTD